MLMKIKLQACLLLVVANLGDINFQVDRMAVDAICSAVPPEMISTLVTKSSKKEAWDSIKMTRIKGEHLRKASAGKLWRDYMQLAFYDGDSVEDFTMHLTSMMNKLTTLGDTKPDDMIVAKYLRITRLRYCQL
jgi:hypothetical protein